MNNIGLTIKGIYRDLLKGPDGRLLYDSGWVANTIVSGCHLLIARSMKGGTSEGIQYLAVGMGSYPPEKSVSEIDKLANEFESVLNNLQVDYLNANGNTTENVASRLQITATLTSGYPKPLPDKTFYPLQEFGLFGRFGGEDYMINYVSHPVIQKDPSMTLVRVIQLSF